MRSSCRAVPVLMVTAWLPVFSGEAGGQPPPPSGGPLLRLAYFVPRDREPTVQHEAKIRVVMQMVDQLYREDLARQGYQTSGLRFEGSRSGPTVALVRGDREAAHYNNAPAYNANQQWQRLLPEIRSKVGNPQRQVLVVFAETYDGGPAPHLWPGVIARGAYNNAEGGLAVFSAHALQSELCATTLEQQKRLLFDPTPVPGRKAFGKRMNSARGEFAEDGVGAVAHELGHALGLPHDRREDSRDVMGNGFRNLRWNYEPAAPKKVGFSAENARLLMCSRYLAGDLQTRDRQPPEVEVAGPAAIGGERTLTLRLKDETGLRAFVIVDHERESVVAGGKLSGKSQEIQQRLPAGVTGDSVMVIVADEGGNQTRKNMGVRRRPGAPEPPAAPD